MQSVLTGYTVYFNRRHNSVGHLLQGRYGAQLVAGDEYLLNLSRYIHLNPVQTRKMASVPAGRKRQYLQRYRWSTYQGYIEKRGRFECVEYAPILSLMAGSKAGQPEAYRKLVEGALAATSDEFVALMKSCPRSIGDSTFRKWVDDEYRKLGEGSATKEDVWLRREADLIDTDTILKAVTNELKIEAADLNRTMRGSMARSIAGLMLCKHGGLSQRAAAELLCYGTGAALSMQLKRLRAEIQSDKKMARQVSRIENVITSAGELTGTNGVKPET